MLRESEWVKNDTIVLILLLCLSAIVCKAQIQQPPKYLDPSLPIERRIDDLLPRLTLEEKIQQISDDWGSKAIPRLKIPSLLKTEGLHSQSYSTGATIFPMPIAMAATFDNDLIAKVGRQTAIESKAAHIRASWSPVLDVSRDVRLGPHGRNLWGISVPRESNRQGLDQWLSRGRNDRDPQALCWPRCALGWA